MSVSVRRSLAVVAATCTVGLLAVVPLTLTSDARRPVMPLAPARNAIVVPGPEQVTGTIDTTGMDWLLRFAAAPSTAGR